MAILTKNANRQKEIDSLNNLVDLIAERSVPDIRDSINSLAKAASNEFINAGGYINEGVYAEGKKDIELIFRRVYKRAVDAFSERQFTAIGKSFQRVYETKNAESLFERLSLEWIAANAAEQASLVTQTTKQEVKTAIQRAQEEGLTTAEVANHIEEYVGEKMAKSRSVMIALTETHNASTFANLKSTQILDTELNLGLKKEWAAVEDARTRPAHAAADGQEKGLSLPFLVNGYKLDRPGDPNGPPSEIIRCRCQILYVRDNV